MGKENTLVYWVLKTLVLDFEDKAHLGAFGFDGSKFGFKEVEKFGF